MSSSAYTFDQNIKAWLKKLVSYQESVPVTEQLLEDVIRRDNIVNIAAKVEVYQLMLEGMRNKLLSQIDHMREFRKNLYEDDELIEDHAITKLIEQEMKVISQAQSKLEKEYLSVKEQCDRFIADTLRHNS